MDERSNEITLHVTLPSGEQTKTIRVNKNCTVKQLKQAIQLETKIEIKSQRLIYMGHIVDDDSKEISEYDIKDNSGIQLSLVMKKEVQKSEYIYHKERKQFIEQLLKSRNSFTLSCLGWITVLQLSGARYPSPGDQLEYPSGTELEIYRQGLLTFNTYVSALQISPIFTPSLSSFQPPSTNHQTGYRVFYLGQWIDALDTVEKWLEATVIGISKEFVFIHYNGWPAVWDEWIHVNSPRLAPFRTHTRHVSFRSNSLPDMITWSGSARPTGPDQSIAILQQISEVTQNVWQKLTAFLQEYQQHIGQPDENEWEEKRQALYQQYAPLLDRVGRLTTDAAMIVQYESDHAVMNHNEAYQPYTQPTIPVPSSPTRIDHPTEGMTSLVNSSFNPDTALLPIRSDSFTSVVVPEGRTDNQQQNNQQEGTLQQPLLQVPPEPSQQANQQPNQQSNQPTIEQQPGQPMVINIPANRENEESFFQTLFEALQRRINEESASNTAQTEEQHSTILSDSTKEKPHPPRESLLKRLQRYGLIDKNLKTPENPVNHNEEVDLNIC